jgi:membrane associated rhomboid family serine protease
MFLSSKTIKQLFYGNVAIFVIGMLLQFLGFPFYQLFALFPQEGFMPHQLITYQFLHGGIIHLLFNMLALISFGDYVENHFGRNKFILFYLLSGLGAAFLHMFMINSSIPMVGSSGAIFGVMIVFAILNPDKKLYLFGIIGFKSKYLVSTIFAIEVMLGFFSKSDVIGHFAHVGGALTGFLLYLGNKYISKKEK